MKLVEGAILINWLILWCLTAYMQYFSDISGGEGRMKKK